MKKVFILISFILFLIGLGNLSLNTPRLSEWMLRRSIQGLGQDVRIEKIKIGGQRFVWPGRLDYANMLIMFDRQGKAYRFECPQLSVSNLQALFSIDRTLRVIAEDVSLRFDLGKAMGMKVQTGMTFKDKGETFLSGQIFAKALSWDRILANNVMANISGDKKAVNLDDISGEAFGGRFTGRADVSFAAVEASYRVQMSLIQIDSAKLSVVNGQLADQVSGRVSGTFDIQGHGEKLATLGADFKLSSGGRINASLLEALTQYLPQSIEKEHLGALIKAGGKLAVEIFSFTIKSNQPDHLSGEMHLASKEVNLNLNLTNDIHTDGTLSSLVAYWQKFLK